MREKKHVMVDRGLLARKDEFRSNQSKVRLSEAGLANLNKPVGEYDENREQPTITHLTFKAYQIV